MKLGNLIEMLKKYPMDAEVYLNYSRYDTDSKIFSTYNDDDGGVFISANPDCIEDAVFQKENYNNVQFNVDDTFELYSTKTDDIITGNGEDFKVLFEAEKLDYDEGIRYNDINLTFAGDLKKFLNAFPDHTPINIRCGESHSGVIHEIEKRTVEYFTGVDPEDGDVYSDFITELFLIYGVPVSGYSGGGSIPLKDNTPPTWTDEIQRVIAEPIMEYFKTNNIILSNEDNKRWGEIVNSIKDNLLKYYNFQYDLNGSWDSNGMFHPYDKNQLYCKPEKKYKED